MTSTILAFTDFRSATIGSRGSYASYLRKEDVTSTITIKSATAPTFATTDSWVISGTNAAVPTTSYESYPTSAVEASGYTGRLALNWASDSGAQLSIMGFDRSQFNTPNYLMFQSFDTTSVFGSAYSSGTIITTTSYTTYLSIGMIVTVSAGTGSFAANTYVTGILSTTEFRVNQAPSVALSGATISASGTSTASSGSSIGNSVTVTSTAMLFVNSIVAVTAGTGAFPVNTYIISIDGLTSFTVSATPSTILSGATITAYNYALGWLTSTTNSGVLESSFSSAVPVGINATINRWIWTNAAAASNGPAAGASSTNSWLISYFTAAAITNFWLFSPKLPFYPSQFSYVDPSTNKINYSDNKDGLIYLGRKETASNVSTTISLVGMPTWVTSPIYSTASSIASGANSGTTISVRSVPNGITIGAPVIIASGSGAFAAGTTILSVSGNKDSFTVSVAPTVALAAGDVILFANNATNNGLPPGLSINSSTGDISGTLDVSGLPNGMTTYKFSIRCDFIFDSGSHSFTGINFAGASSTTAYYEVIKTAAPLESAIPNIGSIGDVINTTQSSLLPSASTVTYQSVALNNPDANAGVRTPGSTNPRRTPIIIIG
jgi:hypothetical protein